MLLRDLAIKPNVGERVDDGLYDQFRANLLEVQLPDQPFDLIGVIPAVDLVYREFSG